MPREKSTIIHLKPVHKDERGEIFDLFDTGEASPERIEHIGFITIKKGAARGSHYHKKSTQYTYIIHGQVEWLTQDLRKKDAPVESRILGPHDLAIDPPGVAHKMIAVEDAEFLDMTDVSRAEGGYEKDTIRVELKK